MTAVAEPVQFPAPRDPVTAGHVERTARLIQRMFPYRTLLDCREVAADVVDRVLSWDAYWPEAEGDCGCYARGLTQHRWECIWHGEATTCPCTGPSHQQGCRE